MTPGQEALAEAARLEAARVYAARCPEPPRAARDRAAELIERLERQGPPVVDLAARRVSTALSTAVRKRIEQAIATAGTPEGVAEATGCDEESVRLVWEAMSA